MKTMKAIAVGPALGFVLLAGFSVVVFPQGIWVPWWALPVGYIALVAVLLVLLNFITRNED